MSRIIEIISWRNQISMAERLFCKVGPWYTTSLKEMFLNLVAV